MRDHSIDRAVIKLSQPAYLCRTVVAGVEGEGPAPSGLPASFKDMLVGMDAEPAWTLSGKALGLRCLSSHLVATQMSGMKWQGSLECNWLILDVYYGFDDAPTKRCWP